MMKKMILVLIGLLIATPTFAKEFIYQGHVKGMSCAFCVYNVRKQISKVPGVKANTVNINLKSGTLNLRSTLAIDSKTINSLVTSAGFTLSDFKQVKQFKVDVYQKQTLLSFKLNNVDIKTYGSILEKIADIAATTLGKLVIKAPKSIEVALLKSLIAGRQQVARVRFIESKTNTIEIDLYEKKK